MKFKDLLIWIGCVLLAIWIVGLFFRVVGWLLNILLIVGGVLVIAWAINHYIVERKKRR